MKQLKEKKETFHIETGWKQGYNRCVTRSEKPFSQLCTRSAQGVYSVHYAASRHINPFKTLPFALASELGQEYIDAIERMEFNDKGIGKERVPCPFETHQNDGWGLRSNATRIIRHDENDYSLQCFKCSTRKRYNKTAQATTRYTINTEHKHATSDMDTERDKNQNVLVQWLQRTEQEQGKHLLILGSAAGTGKTSAAVTTPDSFLYIAKTTEEADDVFEALDRQEGDVYRHRPRLFNRDREDWETLPLGLGDRHRACIQPELCNLHAERIGTPNAICARCPIYTDCKADGYLSQAETEKNASKVIYTENEGLACDEIYKARVKQICAKDDILIIDEVNPLALTQARQFNRDTLLDLTERFRQLHEETASDYQILKALLDLTATAETAKNFIDGLQHWIAGIEDIKAFDAKIERYPVGLTISTRSETAEHAQPFEATICYQKQTVIVPVVDFETGDNTPAYFVEPDTPIATDTCHVRFMPYSFLLKVGLATLEEPPIRHQNLLRDLKTFFGENLSIENAPFTFDAKHQSFDYHLKPTLNHKRVIFNTASDPDNLIGEAYRDTNINITRHTGTPPAWKTDLVFQISTGNYLPRHSLIAQQDGELHLKPRAQEFIDAYIQPSIKAGLKVLVVAPKAFQDVQTVKQWAVTEMADFTPGSNALLTNHHHAEGRNDYQDFDIVFVFHYEPDHSPLQTQAKHIYRAPETPLSFDRDKRKITQASVRFEKNTYTDKRVRSVYNRECSARLMQSAMRLRPNINEDKIIVFLTAEPVDIPVTPIPLHPQDAKRFTGDWTDFKDKLQEKANATVQERIAAGESKSKAYRDTEEARKQEKADRNAEIRQKFADGETPAEIAKALTADGRKVSEKTVRRVLKSHAFYEGQNSQNVISTTYNKMGKMSHPTP